MFVCDRIITWNETTNETSQEEEEEVVSKRVSIYYLLIVHKLNVFKKKNTGNNCFVLYFF